MEVIFHELASGKDSVLSQVLSAWGKLCEHKYANLRSQVKLPFTNSPNSIQRRPKSANIDRSYHLDFQGQFEEVLKLRAMLTTEVEALQQIRAELEDSQSMSEVHLQLERATMENRRFQSALKVAHEQISELYFNKRLLEAEMEALRTDHDRQISEARERVRMAEKAVVAVTSSRLFNSTNKPVPALSPDQEKSALPCMANKTEPSNESKATAHQMQPFTSFRTYKQKCSDDSQFKNYTMLTAMNFDEFDSLDEDDNVIDDGSEVEPVQVSPLASHNSPPACLVSNSSDPSKAVPLESTPILGLTPVVDFQAPSSQDSSDNPAAFPLNRASEIPVIISSPASSSTPRKNAEAGGNDPHSSAQVPLLTDLSTDWNTPILKTDNESVPKSDYLRLLDELDDLRQEVENLRRTQGSNTKMIEICTNPIEPSQQDAGLTEQLKDLVDKVHNLPSENILDGRKSLLPPAAPGETRIFDWSVSPNQSAPSLGAAPSQNEEDDETDERETPIHRTFTPQAHVPPCNTRLVSVGLQTDSRSKDTEEDLSIVVDKYSKLTTDAACICLALTQRIASLNRRNNLDEEPNTEPPESFNLLLNELCESPAEYDRNLVKSLYGAGYNALAPALTQLNQEVELLASTLDAESYSGCKRELLKAAVDTAKIVETERLQLQAELERRMVLFEQNHTSSLMELESSRRALIDQLAASEDINVQLKNQLAVIQQKLHSKERFLAEQTEEREIEREEFRADLSRLKDQLRSAKYELLSSKLVGGLPNDDVRYVNDSSHLWAEGDNYSDTISGRMKGLTEPRRHTFVGVWDAQMEINRGLNSPDHHIWSHLHESKSQSPVAASFVDRFVDASTSPMAFAQPKSDESGGFSTGFMEHVDTEPIAVGTALLVARSVTDGVVQTDCIFANFDRLDASTETVDVMFDLPEVVTTITKRKFDAQAAASFFNCLTLTEESTVVTVKQNQTDANRSFSSASQRTEVTNEDTGIDMSRGLVTADSAVLNDSACPARSSSVDLPTDLKHELLDEIPNTPDASGMTLATGMTTSEDSLVTPCALITDEHIDSTPELLVELQSPIRTVTQGSQTISNMADDSCDTLELDLQLISTAELNGLVEQVTASELVISTMRSEIDDLHKYQEVLQSDYNELQDMLDSRENELEHYTTELLDAQARCTTLEKEIADRKNVILERDEDVYLLSEENETLKQKLKQMEENLASANQFKDASVQVEHDAISCSVDITTADCSNVEDKQLQNNFVTEVVSTSCSVTSVVQPASLALPTSEEQSKVESTETAPAAFSEELPLLVTRLREESARLLSLSAVCSTGDAGISQPAIGSYTRSACSSQPSAIEDLVHANTALKNTLSQMSNHLERLIQAHLAERRCLDSELKSAVGRSDNLSAELGRITDRLASQKEALNRADTLNLRLNNQVNNLKTEYSRVSSDLEVVRLESEEKQEKINQFSSQLAEEQRKNASLRKQADQLKVDVVRLEEELVRASDTITETQNSLRLMTQRAETAERDVEEMRSRLGRRSNSVSHKSVSTSPSRLGYSSRKEDFHKSTNRASPIHLPDEKLLNVINDFSTLLSAARKSADKAERHACELQNVNHSLRLNLAETELRLMPLLASVSPDWKLDSPSNHLSPMSCGTQRSSPHVHSSKLSELKGMCTRLLSLASAEEVDENAGSDFSEDEDINILTGNLSSSSNLLPRSVRVSPVFGRENAERDFDVLQNDTILRTRLNSTQSVIKAVDQPAGTAQTPSSLSSSQLQASRIVDAEPSVSMERFRNLHTRCLRAEGHRRALSFQKRYLVLLLGGFRCTEESVIASLGRPEPLTNFDQSSYSTVDSSDGFLRCVCSSPLRRFRTAGRVVLVIFRMHRLVNRWKRADANNGSTLTPAQHHSPGPVTNICSAPARSMASPPKDLSRIPLRELPTETSVNRTSFSSYPFHPTSSAFGGICAKLRSSHSVDRLGGSHSRLCPPEVRPGASEEVYQPSSDLHRTLIRLNSTNARSPTQISDRLLTFESARHLKQDSISRNHRSQDSPPLERQHPRNLPYRKSPNMNFAPSPIQGDATRAYRNRLTSPRNSSTRRIPFR